MAVRPDYSSGTITLTSGSASFTTTGAALQSASIQQGDTIYLPAKGLVLTIDSITGQNAGTLTGNCPADAAGATQAYAIRFQPDGSRLSGKTQALVELLGNGNVDALAGLTLAADKGLFATGAGTLDLFSLTAFARTLLDDADAATMRQTLGASNFSGAYGDLSGKPTLGSAAAANQQTSTTDTTAGRLMPVGAFGLGGTGISIPDNDYNKAIVPGIYGGAGSSSVNPPPPSNAYGPMLVMARGTTTIVQIAGFGGASNANSLCYRGSTDGGATWSGWTVLGAGGVSGPSSAVAGHLAAFDGTTGKLLKDSGISVANSGPIVILATGQSNIQQHPAYSWTPPTNLFLWNWDGVSDPATSTGTAFTAMPGTSMGIGYSYAAEIAKENPARTIYLINIGIGSMPIANWLPGGSPDMYAACKNNVEAALTAIGVAKIDKMLWWQGEQNWNNFTTYPDDFASVQNRFRTETWFPLETPIAIMGITTVHATVPRIADFNWTLRQVAAKDPATRAFVDTSSLPASYWNLPENIHMTAAGYELAGKMAYGVSENGFGNGAGADKKQVIIKRQNEARANTTTLANDTELAVYLSAGKAYKIKFTIFGVAAASVGFKWGLVGPTASPAYVFTTLQQTDAPAAVVNEAITGYPASRDLTFTANGGFKLEIDIFANNSTASGWLAFQWAQTTLNAASTPRVYYGSTVEYSEVNY